VQEVSIVSGSAPSVHRLANGRRVFPTFKGLRESRTVADKLTRVKVALKPDDAERFVLPWPNCSVLPVDTEHLF
jgi:hypothetical protein